MNKSHTMIAWAAVLLLLVCGSLLAQTTANVTFQVDMRAQIISGAFNPAAGNIVEVAGSFNNWQNPPADTLTDADNDSIYTKTIPLTGTAGSTTHEFKFLQRRATGDLWEDKLPGNRKLDHPAADTTLPVTLFDVPYPNTADVTFQLDMSVQIDRGRFNPASDMVEVAGSFNDWQNDPAAFLSDGDGDKIYTGTFALTGIVGQTVHEYKYLQRTAAGDVWESIADNRKLDHPGANTTLDPVFWDNDPGLITKVVNVTFQVDMSVKMQEMLGGRPIFNPDSNIVEVAGTFNNWQNAPADTMRDPDGDKIYAATLSIDGIPGFTQHAYKHLIRRRGGDVWEDALGGDRKFTHPTQDTTFNVVFYDNDDVVSVPASGNILFQVDAAVLQDIGFLRREAGDVMWTLGSFTGWEGALDDPARQYVMTRVPPGEFHQLLVSYSGLTGDQLPYKFFIEFADSAFYADKFKRAWPMFYGWEEPATRGGGDRRHIFVSGNQLGRSGYWGDLPPQGIIPAGDTVTVTFHIDMNPAIGPGGFNPAQDSVFFHIRAPILGVLLGKRTNEPDRSLRYTDPDGDNIFDLTFDLVGPAPYIMQYVATFRTTNEDHGLDAVGRHRVRYIQPLGPNQFPRSFEFPLDTWNPSPGPAHVIETPPFSPVSAVERNDDAGIPGRYALLDNYPNPFNPSTTIEFDLPKAGHVVLEIYNAMGQRVRTLTDRQFVQGGRYKIEWNGRDGVGRLVGSGVYFYRLKAGDVVLNKKMLLLK